MGEPASDVDIIKSILMGSSGEFRILVDRYSSGIYRFCRVRLGNDDDAEDAVQEVFMRAFRSLRSFRLSGNFPAWLFSIAANRVKSKYHLRERDAEIIKHATREVLLRSPSDAEAAAVDSLRADELRSFMDKLPSRLRLPLELFYFSGLPVSDASIVLGIGIEAFKSRLFRARKCLMIKMRGAAQPRGEGKGI